MGEPASNDNHQPKDRADVDRRVSASNQQRPRKYEDGETWRLKNDHGIFEYDVTIVSAEYDKDNHKWMYVLEDYKGQPIDGEKEETELG